MKSTPCLARPIAFALLTLLLSCVSVGCADDPDPCDGVSCASGACDPATGECTEASCELDIDCQAGYSCEDELCQAVFPCGPDQPCDRGVCEDGACINAPTCDAADDCVVNNRCVESQCVFDPCADVECSRGVCEAGTGRCVNADLCTIDTEFDACLEGFFCYGQQCSPPEDVCNALTCDRGVCDAATQGCANAEVCADDSECLEDFFCAQDTNVCTPNVCDSDFIRCAQGTCEISTGDCINAEVCSDSGECTDGFRCIESACVPVGQECGEECPGNQVCDVDVEAQSAACSENPNGCFRSFDCNDSRVCRDQQCQPPIACEADAYEPNDADTDATVFLDVASANSLDASLCRQDVDVYTYDTREDEDFRGTLVVDLQALTEDRGLGALFVELEGPDGTLLGREEGDVERLRITRNVGALDDGVYTIRVGEAGSSGVSFAGVRYGLFVDLMPSGLADACPNAPLLGNSVESGNSTSGASVQFGSTCTSPENEAAEDIWRFEVTEASFVTLRVTPTSGGNSLTFAIRERCESLTSEIACVAQPNSGSSLQFRNVLAPGTYYVQVQGSQAGTGESYDISLTQTPVTCGPADTTCINESTSRFCNATRTGFETEVCDLGCDDETGFCERIEGDVCRDAIEATDGFSDTITWGDFTNDYDPGPNGCVPDSDGTQTDGPDKTYRVMVPEDGLLDVSLTREVGDYVSVYVAENCDQLDTCLAAANQGPFTNESLTWTNDTGADKEVFIVADIESSGSYGTSTLSVAIENVVCQPNSTRCVNDQVERCNARGTGVDFEPCTFGCNSGACNPVVNGQCSTPIDLMAEPGQTFSGYIDEYSANLNPGFSGCTGSSANGSEAYFTVSGSPGEIATVTLDTPYRGSLWVTTDCDDATQACIVGSDETTSGIEEVQWVIEADTDYVVIADSTSSVASGLFTISATVQSPSCTPGDVLGCVGSSLEYCSDLGVPVDYPCATTCSGSACDEPTGQACIDPIVLTDGGGDSGPFDTPNTLSPGTGTFGACSFSSAPNGADSIYTIDLLAGEFLFVDFTSTSGYAIAYLLQDCSDFSTCLVATNDGSSGSLQYEAVQNERVYLVMDRTLSGTSTLTYDFSVEVMTPNCTPGITPSSCMPDGQTLQYCDAQGFTREHTCSDSCSFDACVDPDGDVCAEAIPVLSGETVSGAFNNSTSSIAPRVPQDGQCFLGSTTPSGRETIYAIDLFEGDVLDLNLRTSYSSALLYVLQDCGSTSSCIAGEPDRGAQRLQFQAPSQGTYYIVVDATSSFASSTSYDLDVDVIQGVICAPNSTRCDISSTSVEFCDATGLGIDSSFLCPIGCQDGSCIPEAASDSCSTAPFVGEGTFIVDSYDAYTDTHSMTSSSCVTSTTPGTDAFYEVNVFAGQVLEVEVESLGSGTPAVYIFGDCQDPELSCVEGARAQDGVARALHLAQTSGSLYVGVDGTTTSTSGPFRLTISAQNPECTPGDYGCALDGVSVDVCNQFGLYESVPCPSGSCTGLTCDNPTGELCFDAIPIGDGESYSSSFGNFDNDIDTGWGPGSCYLDVSNAPDGPDAVFAVDLQAGERLSADLSTTTSTATLYVLDSCTGSAADACVASAPREQSIEYVAAVEGTYYLVVDSDSTFISSSWTLDVDIDSGFVCTPGSSTCQGGFLEVCSQDGFSVLSQSSCGEGCFNAFACAPPATAPDTCADVQVITDSTSIIDSYDRFADTYNLSSASCVGRTTPGPDAIYQVALPANTILFANVTAGYHFDSPAVYIFDDCLGPEASCLDGDFTSTKDATAVYTSGPAETVFVAVDSSSSFDNDYFQLDIRMQPVECSGSQTQCSGDDLLTCNSIGLFDRETCFFGCSSGACLPAPNDACSGAIDVTAGGRFEAPMAEYTNLYDPTGPMDTVDSCTGSGASGPEAVYSMTVNAGDFIELDASATSSANPSIWVSTSCNDDLDAAQSCFVGSDQFGNTESLAFVAPSDGTYFVFADLNGSASSSSVLTLDVEISPTGTCTPGSSSCVDSDTVAFCDNGGTTLVEYPCDGGCSAGFCGTPSGEGCYDAVDVTGGGAFSFDMTTFVDDYNLAPDGCLQNITPGNDVVLRADVVAGDLLHVDVEGASGANPALFLTKDCGLLRDQLNPSCVLGQNRAGTDDELVYRATQDETVYVIIDATSTALDSGTWNVDVTHGTPFCNPGETACLDATTLEICPPAGDQFITHPCAGGCTAGACATPEGSSCGDAIELLSGNSVMQDFTGTNTTDFGVGQMGNCTLEDAQAGTDYFYYVDLLDGQTLDASFTSTSAFGTMYLTLDCANAQACLESGGPSGNSGAASYTATGNQRVYIVMDRALSGSTASYNYTLDVTVN